MCGKHYNVSFTGCRLRLYTGSCHPIIVICCLMNAIFSQKPLCNCIAVCSQISGHGRQHSNHHCTENSGFYLSATGSENATSGILDFMSEKLRRTLYSCGATIHQHSFSIKLTDLNMLFSPKHETELAHSHRNFT